MLLKAKIQAYEGGHTPSYGITLEYKSFCLMRLELVDLGYGSRNVERNGSSIAVSCLVAEIGILNIVVAFKCPLP